MEDELIVELIVELVVELIVGLTLVVELESVAALTTKGKNVKESMMVTKTEKRSIEKEKKRFGFRLFMYTILFWSILNNLIDLP